MHLLWAEESGSTSLSLRGFSIKQTSHRKSVIRTVEAIPPDTNLYYFEMTVVKGGDICIGLTTRDVCSSNQFPGDVDGSIGYHGEYGGIYHNRKYIPPYGKYGTGDTVGCCLKRINIDDKTYPSCFFTRNGIKLGPTVYLDDREFYPTIGLGNEFNEVETNLGQKEYFISEFILNGKLFDKAI